jgi:hypothetical protein
VRIADESRSTFASLTAVMKNFANSVAPSGVFARAASGTSTAVDGDADPDADPDEVGDALPDGDDAEDDDPPLGDGVFSPPDVHPASPAASTPATTASTNFRSERIRSPCRASGFLAGTFCQSLKENLNHG